MTNSNPLNIKSFDKVCKVSTIISQVCQIRGLDWLEKTLLNKWAKTVMDKQVFDERVAFIIAKYAFIAYLESERNSMKDEPITAFLIDTIKFI